MDKNIKTIISVVFIIAVLYVIYAGFGSRNVLQDNEARINTVRTEFERIGQQQQQLNQTIDNITNTTKQLRRTSGAVGRTTNNLEEKFARNTELIANCQRLLNGIRQRGAKEE